MSIIDRILKRASPEVPATPITAQLLSDTLSGPESATGARINPSTAMQISTVFACVKVISETLATLPLHTYRRLPRGRELAPEHPVYDLLLNAPNPEMTSVELIETLCAHVLLYGNAYCEVVRNGAGQVKALWPLLPHQTHPARNARNELVYETRLPDGSTARLRAERVLHIRGLGYDGLVGYSPIALHREALGLAVAAQEFGARFFSNDSRPGGILVHPGKLSQEAANRLKLSWEAAHAGLANKHRVAILEEGMKWEAIGIPPEDAQYLQLREFQRTEIAAIFRVPPHKIGDLSRATFSNIEQQDIDFAKSTISPWAVRFEKAINKTLFTEEERRTYFVKFSLQALLRGDMQSRYNAYAIARQNGWMTANEIRELEDMNPIEGGDVILVNGNMMPVGQQGNSDGGE